MSGRENSVAKLFHRQLVKSCGKQNLYDLSIPLCGADRHFNADEMFAANDWFLLIEFKSGRRNVKAENTKLSACRLCTSLRQHKDAEHYHRQCHYVMWGKKIRDAGLKTHGGIYQDLVCRPDVLPACIALKSETVKRVDDKAQIFLGEELASKVAQKKAGLHAAEFSLYLQWLLGLRGGENTSQKFPIVLFGISMTGPLESYAFSSLHELAKWADLGAIPKIEPDEKPAREGGTEPSGLGF
ncbi:hypothetical protein [Pseudomonas sp. UMAB-40]|uniref:hypothetical protein n=1 Tax=Pseudomonas sp. UMAB-40 TaxID=1365407 RepID=UPI001C55E9CA|nr:hypothetical protein [Pseudomonas sp. UMAB-40]